jgi:restriction system protein
LGELIKVEKNNSFIPPHGGYRKLRSFQCAQQVYDLTVAFCDRFVDKRSRTHDQMVQAARSGVQNIAEGSMASATSKKTELKLTGVARASLEELLLDYEDFLRQRGIRLWKKDSPEALAVRKKYQSDKSDRSDLSDGSDKTGP